MGTAFPVDDLGSDETVLFLMYPRREGDAELVCHAPHAECEVEMPHQMSECGRFVAGADPDV